MGGARRASGLHGGEVSTATLNHFPRGTIGRRPSADTEARYGRLFETFRSPAKGMVRKAYGTSFCEDELDDFYSSAWLSTLGAFERKPRELSDEELRRYLMTAVANQANREMRRRGRKPTVSLDSVPEGTAEAETPDEIASHEEEASITREILGSLPRRRRTVLMYRYGWDLEPSEVCELVDGLSPRAYRKEIERGVAEVAKKMRLVDEGGWCETREPLLRAVVAGMADDDEKRQAQRHLANCRSCATFVSKLSGRLHEIGGTMAFAGLADGAGVDASSLVDRGVAVVERAKSAIGSAVSRGSDTAEAAAGQAMTAGGTRGAGVASVGALAKLAGFGAVPKLVAACRRHRCGRHGVRGGRRASRRRHGPRARAGGERSAGGRAGAAQRRGAISRCRT